MQPVRRIRTRELVAMMSMVMALSAMAIDFMTPAFGEIRVHYRLGVESTAAAQIITFFFLGQVGQIVYGPLSDRFGRLPVLRGGFGIYAVGSVAAALAPTFGFMLAARFFWGLGAAALQVSASAIIRDRFRGDEMARVMSLVMSIFLLVPIVAPLAGAGMLRATSWQVVFGFPAILALVMAVWSMRLVESRPESNIVALEFAAVSRAFRYVMQNRLTVRYTFGAMLLFAGFSSFLSSFERVMGEIYGRPALFPFVFAGITAFTAGVMLGNARLVRRVGAKRSALLMLAVNTIAAGIYVALTVSAGGLPELWITVALLTAILGVNTAASINFGSLALEPMGEQTGMAAAIYGSAYVGGGALLGSLIDRQLVTTVTPWAVALLVTAIGAVALVPGPRLRRAEGLVEV